MDSFAFMQEMLNSTATVATDYHAQPAIQRGKDYYRVLATAPAKVHEACKVLPKAPPGRRAA